MFSIKYNKDAGAVYIWTSRSKVSKTEELSSTCLVDLDKKGNIIGIELLGAKSVSNNQVKLIVDLAKQKKGKNSLTASAK